MQLDPSQTYLIGVTGEGKQAEEIRRVSLSACIPESERWVHCGCAFYDGQEWRVIDCDFDDGVREITLQAALGELASRPGMAAKAYPVTFDIDVLRAMIGRPFSKRKFYAFKSGQDMPRDRGLTCGELLALADGGIVCAAFRKFAAWIRSVDWQEAVQGVPGIDLRGWEECR